MRRLVPYIRRRWRTLFKAFLWTIIFTACWPLLARFGGLLLGYLVQGKLTALLQTIGVVAGLFLVQKIAQYGQDSLSAKAAFSIAYDIRKQVYAHLHQLSLSYFEVAQTGDLSYRLTEDIDRIGELINKIFHDSVPCILQLIVVFAYMLWVNWQLTVASLVVVPLMSWLISWFGDRMLLYSRQSQNLVSDLSSFLTETFSGIRLIRAFAAEDYAIDRFNRAAWKNRQAKYSMAWLQAVQFPAVGLMYALSVLILLFLGGWQISLGNLTGQSFGTFILAVGMLVDPIAHLTQNFNEYKQGQASLDRIFELFEIQPIVTEAANAIALPPVTGKVEYRNLSFRYQSQQSGSEQYRLDKFGTDKFGTDKFGADKFGTDKFGTEQQDAKDQVNAKDQVKDNAYYQTDVESSIQKDSTSGLQQVHTSTRAKDSSGSRSGNSSRDDSSWILQDFNLIAHPGEAIALVGSSGAGKTTLVNLLPRFYDPQLGQILIDGVDIRTVSLKSLRRQIGIVPQETTLFAGTIAQNIAFGQRQFELEAVQSAAQVANAHGFISQFPDGYQTWVGERGVNLSGGQRQRIAIARAVLLNPRILILDEATSALDSESELLVQEALERLMSDRTVFIIAHRLATVRRADRILVIEKGRVVEAGTHEMLLAQGDRYARFYAQQFQA